MNKKETRKLKLYGQSGYRYQDTPAIILKGKWLEDAGFTINDRVEVNVGDGELRIRRTDPML